MDAGHRRTCSGDKGSNAFVFLTIRHEGEGKNQLGLNSTKHTHLNLAGRTSYRLLIGQGKPPPMGAVEIAQRFQRGMRQCKGNLRLRSKREFPSWFKCPLTIQKIKLNIHI